jgi:hypothetical protein
MVGPAPVARPAITAGGAGVVGSRTAAGCGLTLG